MVSRAGGVTMGRVRSVLCLVPIGADLDSSPQGLTAGVGAVSGGVDVSFAVLSNGLC